MNIDLASEPNHISKIKCEHRSDHSSLAACCEPSFINSEIKTLRPHLHLHGGCWFQTVNCIDPEEAHSSEMCCIKYTWEQFSREFSEWLPAAIDAFWQICCSLQCASVPLGLVSLFPSSILCTSPLSVQHSCPLLGLGTLGRAHWSGWDASKDSRGV